MQGRVCVGVVLYRCGPMYGTCYIGGVGSVCVGVVLYRYGPIGTQMQNQTQISTQMQDQTYIGVVLGRGVFVQAQGMFVQAWLYIGLVLYRCGPKQGVCQYRGRSIQGWTHARREVFLRVSIYIYINNTWGIDYGSELGM